MIPAGPGSFRVPVAAHFSSSDWTPVKTSAAHPVYKHKSGVVLHDIRKHGFAPHRIIDAALEAHGLPGSVGGQVGTRSSEHNPHGLELQHHHLNHYHMKSVHPGLVISSRHPMTPEETRPLARHFLKHGGGPAKHQDSDDVDFVARFMGGVQSGPSNTPGSTPGQQGAILADKQHAPLVKAGFKREPMGDNPDQHHYMHPDGRRAYHSPATGKVVVHYPKGHEKFLDQGVDETVSFSWSEGGAKS